MMRDLIAAILVAILIDVSWNAAGMRDPLPEPPPERAPIIVQSSQPTYNMVLPSAETSTALMYQSTTGSTTWYASGEIPAGHCFVTDSAGNIVDAGGTCAAAR